MLSHVHVGITDFERSYAFYSPLMEALGLTLKFREPEQAWAGWIAPGTGSALVPHRASL